LAFLHEYGLFLAQLATLLLILLALVVVIGSLSQRQRGSEDGYIEVRNLNERYRSLQDAIHRSVLSDAAYKADMKRHQREEKARLKAEKRALKKVSTATATPPSTGSVVAEPERAPAEDAPVARPDEGEGAAARRPRLFILAFAGDIRASAVDNLREEISTVLPLLHSGDEVLVRLESAGGQVHTYGLAASQLQRITDAGARLTVAVDAVAASGGYLMACVAPRIVAAPFAILGSIGVLAQIPNFHRVLKKNDIDYELLTAGEYKRTLTMFGENTDKGRAKFQEDLEDIHRLFKTFVSEHRPQLDVDRVATGEIWFGSRALDLGLIDEIGTSDSLIQARLADWDVLQVSYRRKKSWQEKLGFAAEGALERSLLKIWQQGTQRLLP